MSTENYIFITNLQLFADGAAAGTGTGDGGQAGSGLATAETGVTSDNPAVRYGVQREEAPQVAAEETQEEANVNDFETRKAAFDARRKGEDKDLFDAWANETIQRRMKGTKDIVDRYNEAQPLLETLARKYGVDATDLKALEKAMDDDDSYFEEEAFEKGVSVAQLKEIRKMEKENAQLKAQMQEAQNREQADRIMAQWMQDAESLKQVYPSFNLDAEMQNGRFVDLLRNNIDVRTAYEVIHKDDIMRGAMQFTAQKVGEKISNKIRAGGQRPTENGITSQSPALAKSDVSKLTREQRAEINAYVARGGIVKL